MLKFVRLSYDAETLYWINSENYLTRLIVEFFSQKLETCDNKTVSELRQKFWICTSRGFVREVLKECTLCKRFKGQSF